MALGRTFTEAEAAPERQPRVAVLSHPSGDGDSDADANVIGRELTINGEPFAVIGVLPASYRSVKMVEDPDLYVPISALVLPTVNDRNNGNALNVLARLHTGTTREQASRHSRRWGVNSNRPTRWTTRTWAARLAYSACEEASWRTLRRSSSDLRCSSRCLASCC